MTIRRRTAAVLLLALLGVTGLHVCVGMASAAAIVYLIRQYPRKAR
jgi:hypothetical protein